MDPDRFSYIFPGDTIEILNEEKYAALLQNNDNVLTLQNISDIYLDEQTHRFYS